MGYVEIVLKLPTGYHDNQLKKRIEKELGISDFSYQYEYAKGYQAPFCRIQDFIHKKEPAQTVESSYPLGLKPAPLWELLPSEISHAIREGLNVFSRKIKGFETGVIMYDFLSEKPLRLVYGTVDLAIRVLFTRASRL
ncbi:MAG: hypothetical protein HF978_08655 [Desulfobacteraceae bacterium]|nr:hypothetical protein [Desulfobacteraceae bacterium]MBC2755602.1 hypothetical protein [Desulfobacteraceae bacterium]